MKPYVLIGLVAVLLVAEAALLHPPQEQAALGAVDCAGCNVVIIVIDAARQDHFGVYGYGRNTTPFIDAFAGNSFVFDEAVSQATWTTPSVASLFTGLYPSRHGVDLNNQAGAGGAGASIPESLGTLAEDFRGRSYRTVGIVRNAHLSDEFNFGKGFDWYDMASSDKELTEKMTGFIDSGDAQGRFFAYLHLFGTHMPYKTPQEYAAMFMEQGYSPVNTSTQRQRDYLKMSLNGSQLAYVISQYDGKLAYTDGFVESIIMRLRERGLLERTIVVVTADHGEDFLDHPGLFGHGWEPYETQIRVPLIIWDPASSAPSRITSQARTVDIMPTLIDLSGGSVPEGLDGVSLRPALLGQDMRLAAYSEMQFRGDPYRALAVRLGGWKLICNLAQDDSLTNCRLFDIVHDPLERTPQAGPEGLEKGMEEQLREYYETNIRLRPAGSGRMVGLSNGTIEELMALGYLE
jgi:choline-sulfatase